MNVGTNFRLYVRVSYSYIYNLYRCRYLLKCVITLIGTSTGTTPVEYILLVVVQFLRWHSDVADCCIGTSTTGSTPPVLSVLVKLVRTISFLTGGSNNYHKLLLPPVSFGTFSTRILFVDCCPVLTLVLLSLQYAICLRTLRYNGYVQCCLYFRSGTCFVLL
jgi:hypothetical protein